MSSAPSRGLLRRFQDFAVQAGALARSTPAKKLADRAQSLLDDGLPAEAEALAAEGLQTFPDDPSLLFASAVVAQHGGRVHDAIERWMKARDAAPERIECHLLLAVALREAAQPARARVVIAEAGRRFPDELALQVEGARVAEAEGDLRDALARYERLCAMPVVQAEWVAAQARLLVRLSRFEEAERLASDWLERYSAGDVSAQARGFIAIRGLALSAREDWTAAVAFWSDFHGRFPNSRQGWQQLGLARHGAAMSRIERAPSEEAGMDERAQIDVVADEASRRLLLQFESLGESCEFGLVQRRYGAEPLGLLRWNTVELACLVAALDERLAGVGEPAKTEMVRAFNGELMLRDRRWGFTMHTWLFAGTVDEDALHAKMCRRIAFLRDKLLADLEAAEKTFVFMAARDDATGFAALHEAIGRYGPCRLLIVRPGAETPGQVREVARNRFVGSIRRSGRREDGVWDIVFDDWIAVCEAVAAPAPA